jgi:hypothetical protein
LGKRVFALAGWGLPYSMTNTVEEYHYGNRSWTLITNSMFQERRYFAAISVPALFFQNVKGGCVGVL